MKSRLYLHIPSFDELYYRKKILCDPDTMNYNKGYDLKLRGYNRETGCIDFPESNWRSWFDYFIGNEPERYYAYIVKTEDDAFIGEVNVHKNASMNWHEMGIVLEAQHRGNGYAVEALRLLLRQAFEVMDAEAVHNDFEDVRDAAVKTHLSVGFTEFKKENSMLELIITRQQYYNQKVES